MSDNLRNYLFELKEFMILKKEDFREYEGDISVLFNFDFSTDVDKQIADMKPGKYRYKIFHSEKQKKMIKNLLRVFSTKNIMGFGRLIQKTNMELLYRVSEVTNIGSSPLK